MIDKIELLAPARDLECGLAAIDCGADAVYIGATRFGARAKAGNSVADIKALARHAHKYWAKVYVTLNTLLHDDELPSAVNLAHQLYEAGVDALIVQDVGLLECDLPPLPLIASTQMHNATPARVAFLEQVGFQRVILARELDLEQIKAIRQQTSIELEFFAHGALCVGYSGQCYMSYAIGGRSGNRGECAQPCRRSYRLVDQDGKTLVKNRHLLSLRDLNLSEHLGDLIDVGVTSFKIEGRLKDRAYIVNVVSHYRRQLDDVLRARGLSKSSSGQSQIDFEPDPIKTFNRTFTTHFLHGRAESPGSIDTPKMVGEFVGQVVRMNKRSFELEPGYASLHNGDGLCFFDLSGTLRGTTVNGVRGQTIFPHKLGGIQEGTRFYRNHDHVFLTHLKKSRIERKIGVSLKLGETPKGFILSAVDEDGNMTMGVLVNDKAKAEKPEKVLTRVRKQLRKMGGTEFVCTEIEIDWQDVYFVPLSDLNALRRRTLDKLAAARANNRPVLEHALSGNNVPYPEKTLTYLGNVLNQQATAFYQRHGVTQIAPAAESGLMMHGERVMRTRYCIKHQLGYCHREGDVPRLREPLYLVDEDGHEYELRFDCAACEMEVFF
ncbi:MAG: U32 family peptidase [Chloroflexi bacterium]|nr:U32 family peptidase [Chloroflexota bacterium]